MGNIIRKARQFAENAHKGQTRKYTNKPYITHPVSVSLLVNGAISDDNSNIIAAAVLHDVVEDTAFTVHDIAKNFGIEIADLVEELTDITRPSDGNRKARKKIERDRLSKTSISAKTIKLADLVHNSRSILKYDPKFAKVYMKEMKALLEVLQEGNVHLLKMATEIVEYYYEKE